MNPSCEFFSGNRYAIFGVKARGRMQGGVLIAALTKAGKKAVAIEAGGVEVKGADVSRSLSEAGSVDGAVLLPPDPWDESAREFTADAVRQCREQGVARVWIYTAGDSGPAAAIAGEAGMDPVVGRCPCLYVEGGGFPHSLHSFLLKLAKRY
ncbi:MAG TPA: CoA-binding protein [Armatimonadota bacterium]|jgi:predicted CoA-binding protein